jgi:hypothetical protein
MEADVVGIPGQMIQQVVPFTAVPSYLKFEFADFVGIHSSFSNNTLSCTYAHVCHLFCHC